MELLKRNEADFIRERQNLMNKLNQNLPVLCSRYKGFYANHSKQDTS